MSEVCYNTVVYALLQRFGMLKKVGRPIMGCLFVLVLLLPWHPGQAQQETPAQYFRETGHYLSEPFLSFFETEGGLQACGPPITEAIEENGHLVQYFQRARMECVTAAQGSCEVHLSPLGELLGRHTPRTSPVSDSLIRSGLCRYFPDTGHNVCFSFLTFYLDQGGPDVFGPPISELAVEPGMIIQYFQRARIEWEMDSPLIGDAMHFGAIGEEYFRAKDLDPNLLSPAESQYTSQNEGEIITVGVYVRVTDTEGAGLRFRSGAGLNHAMTQMLEEGAILRVVGGPETVDGFTWWHLDYHGSLGWCADKWLERIETRNSP